MKTVKFLARFYLPIFLACAIGIVAIASATLNISNVPMDLKTDIHVGIVGFSLPLELIAKNAQIARCVALFVSALLIIYALSVDFSLFFPRQLKMDVYFDRRGLERVLKSFGNAIEELRLGVDWQNQVGAYDSEVITRLQELWQKRGTGKESLNAEEVRGFLHASGSTSFVVRRTGLGEYRIIESNGLLNYEVDLARKRQISFRSEFRLRETAENHVSVSLLGLLRKRPIVVMPEFKQAFSIEDSGDDAPFDHIVVGATRLRLFPVPAASQTIYLWKTQNGAVPVAYCVYYAD